MQVSELQVQRSLFALNHVEPVEPVESAGGGDEHAARDRADACPDGLIERLTGSPAIRPDRTAEARKRLEAGDQPSADDLARRMVGRLVCDRLR
jgi:hypothetical protein